MKKNFLAFLFLFSALCTNAQNQNKMWYFGSQAGLDFNSGSPVAVTNSAMIQNEGTASISDASGNLLFYTDGVTVWNRNNVQMPNGHGLLGNSSSTQSALIVPKPNDCNVYYIFTVPAQDTITPMCYSVVDISLHGGLGDVTLKNIPLHHPVTERLTGTLHSNGRDYWVTGQEYKTNNFLSFLVSPAGLDTVPVISSNPSINTADFVNSVLGYMKISPDGSKLAFCYLYYDGTAILMDYNNSTGMVSNPLVLNAGNYYGVEFSPNNSKLYFATIGSPFTIVQYNLAAGSPSAIQSSVTTITSIGFINSQIQYGGALQLAPDGKIYADRMQRNSLGAINNPNLLGTACNYVDSVIYLGGKTCLDGLPNLIKSYSACSIQNGISEYATTPGYELAPNPFNDFTTLTFANPEKENCSLYIYNISSQLVEKRLNITSGELTIKKQDLSEGLFFFQIKSDKRILAEGKFLVR